MYPVNLVLLTFGVKLRQNNSDGHILVELLYAEQEKDDNAKEPDEAVEYSEMGYMVLKSYRIFAVEYSIVTRRQVQEVVRRR